MARTRLSSWSVPLTAAAVALAGALAAPATAGAAAPDGMRATSVDQAAPAPLAPRRARAPRLRVRQLVGGLDIPWDVQPVGRNSFLVTERARKRLSLVHKGRRRTVRFPRGTVWESGETGLMSLAVAPDFARSRRFHVCHGGYTGRGHDVRVVSYRLSANGRRAVSRRELLTGLPATSGRHGGCRLLVDRRTGALYVGTGDAAVGTNPQDLTSLGGKVLRLDPATGAPWPSNPFIGADNRRTRYVLTYGHRNVQGLAQRSDGTVWSVEHGSDRDDEVNLLTAGGDYGWNPVPGYDDDDVPMTDHSLPGTQIDARWSSGRPTLATSGAAWVPRRGWGALGGTLAVAALKTEQVLFMTFDRNGRFRGAVAPRALRRYGRLRSVTVASGGRLLVTTSDGDGRDSVLVVTRR